MKRYKPMLAREAKEPFMSPEWIFEPKWDGIRAIAYVGEELSLRSRNDKELIDRFPELDELKELAEDVVLDGEIIVMREGSVDFQAVLRRMQQSDEREIARQSARAPASYVVFDILEKDGETLTDLPLTERKRILKESLQEGGRVTHSPYVENTGENYYKAAVQTGLEGLVAKKKGGRYIQGKSESWLKIKDLKTCDCVIVGYTIGRGMRDTTFGALLLGLYDEDELIYVGKVGIGFSDLDLYNLSGLFKGIEVEEETIPNVDVLEVVTWLKPVLVCNVGYQTVTEEGGLRIPRFLDMRAKKDPRECQIDQIRPPELGVYREMRDFSVTPEPEGGTIKNIGKRFVVQEHHASRLHYDLRLERGGVLKSWAVPKGVPEKPGIRRLAVHVEDHPLEYGDFEGTIPAGEYGAGTVTIWDSGLYEPLIWQEDKIEFILQGERLGGRYVLVRLKKAKENEWLLLKAKDE